MIPSGHGAAADLLVLILVISVITGLGIGSAALYGTHVGGMRSSADAGSPRIGIPATLRTLGIDSHPHPIGSAANSEVRERLTAALRGLGYQPEIQSGELVCSRFAVCGMPANIVTRIPGAGEDSPSAPTSASATDGFGSSSVLVVAHYDSVPAGPGVCDDGAGVVAILSIASALQRLPRPRHPIILLLDDGEEFGLLGAELFAQRHRWAQSVKAAINLEARGTSGPSLMFETGSANGWLMRLYAHAIATPLTNSVWYALYSHMPNGTDFKILKTRGAQGYNLAFIGENSNYHTPQDDLSHANWDSVKSQSEQALKLLLELANSDIDHPSTEKIEYFDFLSLVLIRIPSAVMAPAALVILIGACVVIVVLWRKRYIELQEVGWSTLAIVAALASAGLASWLLKILVNYMAGSTVPVFVADQWAFVATFAVLAAVIIICLSGAVRIRAGFWSFFCAITIVYASISLFLANVEPGTSYVLLFPAAIGLTAAAIRILATRYEGLLGVTAAIIQLALSGSLVSPFVSELYPALGTHALPLITTVLVLSALPIAALFIERADQIRNGVLTLCILALLAGVILDVSMPVYTGSSREKLNIQYVVNGEEGTQRAHWFIQSESGHLPQAFGALASFQPRRYPQFPWERRYDAGATRFISEAPSIALPEPELSIVSTAPVDSRNDYRIRVRSARGSPALLLAFPPVARAHISSVMPAGTGAATQSNFDPGPDGWTLIWLVNIPASGIDLLISSLNVGFDAILLDRSYGLPPIGESLLRARPDRATPVNEGDVTIVSRMVSFQRQRTPTRN